jgi:hypothetical protein
MSLWPLVCIPSRSPRFSIRTFAQQTTAVVCKQPRRALVTDSLFPLAAKKLPLTQPQAKTGTVRGATSAQRGVDLNKGQNLQSTEACAC